MYLILLAEYDPVSSLFPIAKNVRAVKGLRVPSVLFQHNVDTDKELYELHAATTDVHGQGILTNNGYFFLKDPYHLRSY